MRTPRTSRRSDPQRCNRVTTARFRSPRTPAAGASRRGGSGSPRAARATLRAGARKGFTGRGRGRTIQPLRVPGDGERRVAMTKGREIRCFDYVNHPYEGVRDALAANALEVFRSATHAAAARAHAVASQLRVDIGGVEVSTDIEI